MCINLGIRRHDCQFECMQHGWDSFMPVPACAAVLCCGVPCCGIDKRWLNKWGRDSHCGEDPGNAAATRHQQLYTTSLTRTPTCPNPHSNTGLPHSSRAQSHTIDCGQMQKCLIQSLQNNLFFSCSHIFNLFSWTKIMNGFGLESKDIHSFQVPLSFLHRLMSVKPHSKAKS